MPVRLSFTKCKGLTPRASKSLEIILFELGHFGDRANPILLKDMSVFVKIVLPSKLTWVSLKGYRQNLASDSNWWQKVNQLLNTAINT
jgi:hypothetical protein